MTRMRACVRVAAAAQLACMQSVQPCPNNQCAALHCARLPPACSLCFAAQAFVLLGLRHLIVVDAQNRIVGMVTRKDLDHASGHGWWRMSAQAPKPHRRPHGGGGGGRRGGINK